MDNKILVTGGDGRFAKVLKNKNKKLKLIFCSKKQLNILNLKSIKKKGRTDNFKKILVIWSLLEPLSVCFNKNYKYTEFFLSALLLNMSLE